MLNFIKNIFKNKWFYINGGVFLAIIFVVSLIYSCIYGKSEQKIKKIQDDLQTAVEHAKQKEENEEKLILQCDELKKTNEELQNNMNRIKTITDSANKSLGTMETSVNDATTILKQLKENQKLFKVYIKEVNKVLEEQK